MPTIVATERTRVLVTGAHRSGTTVASRMIADELGLPWDTESRVAASAGGRFDFEHVAQAMAAAPVVMHGATCFTRLNALAARVPDLAVVYVWRDVEAVRASAARTGIKGAQVRHNRNDPVRKFGEFAAFMAEHDVECHVLVYPHSFWHHPLWAHDRKGWAQRQVDPDGTTAFDPEGVDVRHD